jgi:hypothetical protein
MIRTILIITIAVLITAASTIASAYIDKRTIFENPQLKAEINYTMGKKFIQIREIGSNELINTEKLVNEEIKIEK